MSMMNNPHFGAVDLDLGGSGRTAGDSIHARTVFVTDEDLAALEQEIAEKHFGESAVFEDVAPMGDVHDPADDCEASHS